MKKVRLYNDNVLLYLITSVWLINGLFCKVLNFVPRHEQIVARILKTNYTRPITFVIGLLEIFMAIWILSRFERRINAIFQIVIIATMNALEFILAPDLLLWGKANSIFALLFIFLIYFNEFHNNREN